VQRALLTEGIQLEAYGGDIPSVRVSGLTGQGLPDLVETLSAVAEMQDLSVETDGKSFGHVLESKVQKGLGCVLSFSTILSLILASYQPHCDSSGPPWFLENRCSRHRRFEPRQGSTDVRLSWGDC
jgi:hypothetical protein